MSIRLLVDMNLSPDWADWFARRRQHAVHWSAVGDPQAPDHVILQWARENGHVVRARVLPLRTSDH